MYAWSMQGCQACWPAVAERWAGERRPLKALQTPKCFYRVCIWCCGGRARWLPVELLYSHPSCMSRRLHCTELLPIQPAGRRCRRAIMAAGFNTPQHCATSLNNNGLCCSSKPGCQPGATSSLGSLRVSSRRPCPVAAAAASAAGGGAQQGGAHAPAAIRVQPCTWLRDRKRRQAAEWVYRAQPGHRA